MFKFIYKLFLLFLLVFLVGLGIYKAIPADETIYMAALIDKEQLIDSLHNTGESKIVLVGGSNVSFGVNSQIIEEAFDMPVYNMSMHASLRYEYMLNQLRNHMGEGDYFLIFPEYSQLYRPLSKGNSIIYQSLEVYPKGYDYVHQRSLPKIRAEAAVEILQIKVRRQIADWLGQGTKLAYKRQIFDEYGDIWMDLTLKSNYKKNDRHIGQDRDEKVSKHFINMTNEFSDQVREAGGQVLIVYPAIAEAKYDSISAYNTYTVLSEKLNDPIVNEPGDYIYPDTLFFDSKYHTTQEGRDIRTIQTIEDLRPYIK